MNGPYNAIEMEILDNPGYETEGTDGKFGSVLQSIRVYFKI